MATSIMHKLIMAKIKIIEGIIVKIKMDNIIMTKLTMVKLTLNK